MARYDYHCRQCGRVIEKSLPITSNPSTILKCGSCGKLALHRMICLTGVTVATAAISYQNRFPYVSSALPFGGHLAGGGRHVGPLKKILVESRAHEDRLRATHGYVGESQVA